MASDLANERPIDARTESWEGCVEYVNPNSLLLGRTGPRGDPGTFDFEAYFFSRQVGFFSDFHLHKVDLVSLECPLESLRM